MEKFFVKPTVEDPEPSDAWRLIASKFTEELENRLMSSPDGAEKRVLIEILGVFLGICGKVSMDIELAEQRRDVVAVEEFARYCGINTDHATYKIYSAKGK